MSEYSINRPVKFQGSPAQLAENRMSHQFWANDGIEYRCVQCDCKPWHAAASYQCGSEIPRETVTYLDRRTV